MQKFLVYIFVLFLVGCSTKTIPLEGENGNFFISKEIDENSEFIPIWGLFQYDIPLSKPVVYEKSEDGEIFIQLYKGREYKSPYGVVINDPLHNASLGIVEGSYDFGHKSKKRKIYHKEQKDGYERSYELVCVDNYPYVYFSWTPLEVTKLGIFSVDIKVIVINNFNSKYTNDFLKYSKTLLPRKVYNNLCKKFGREDLVEIPFNKREFEKELSYVLTFKQLENFERRMKKKYKKLPYYAQQLIQKRRDRIQYKKESRYQYDFRMAGTDEKAIQIAKEYLAKYPHGFFSDEMKEGIAYHTQEINKRKKQELLKEHYKEVIGKYLTKKCKLGWDGEIKNNWPVGKGCFSCRSYFGFYAHDYYKICTEVKDRKINKGGTVLAIVTEGTFLGHRTKVYKDSFSDPSMIRSKLLKVGNQATKEWNEYQRRISSNNDTSSFYFDSDIKIKTCSEYKLTNSNICNIDYKNSYWGSITYKYDSHYHKYIIHIRKDGNWGETGYYYPQRGEVLYKSNKYKAKNITDALKIIANLRIKNK